MSGGNNSPRINSYSRERQRQESGSAGRNTAENLLNNVNVKRELLMSTGKVS